MSPQYPDVAAAIRSARLRKGWSQERAAIFVGVTRFHWIRWEQGLHLPNEEHRPLLVEMGVDPQVFQREDTRDRPDGLIAHMNARYPVPSTEDVA